MDTWVNIYFSALTDECILIVLLGGETPECLALQQQFWKGGQDALRIYLGRDLKFDKISLMIQNYTHTL